jgi:hypothetical protein
MNERIEQCKADIAKLQAELNRLENEEKPKPRHGDIVQFYGGRRIIVISPGIPDRAYNKYGDIVAGRSLDRLYYNVIGNVFDGGSR